MLGSEPEAVRRQYRSTDPLKVRMRTHERYQERPIDLDRECWQAMALDATAAVLEVGCGPGRFLHYLRGQGHAGVLVGLDQSPAMLAEAHRLTAGEAAPVALVRGDAMVLPFPPGCFRWVVARHMLYHLPDIPAALREFARVLAPGGSVLAVTNAADYLPKIRQLGVDLLRAFGLPQPERAGTSFHQENGRQLLAAAYGNVEELVLDNALLFREPEPIAEYLATAFSSWSLPEESDLPRRMGEWLVAEAGRRLAAQGGVWRDPKPVVLFRCRVGNAADQRNLGAAPAPKMAT